jgi:prophage antirepressor-like protein
MKYVLFTKQYKDKGVNASYYTLYIMDIIRAFTTNSLHTEIVIKGTIEAPLFRASDIALILEISNIRASIKDFNDSEKVVQTMTTPGGPQKVLFLTRTGLFRLLFRSKNPIALQVQYWVCDVVKELQINQRKKNDMMKLQESIESENISLNQRHAPNDELMQMKLENEKLKSALEMTTKNNQNIFQELVKTVQHLSSQIEHMSSQIEKLEKTVHALCEKINTIDPFSKKQAAN